MASGSFSYQLPSTSSHFLRLDWSSTINVANNTSTITASLYYVLTNSAAAINVGSRANSYVSYDGSQETFTANAISFSGVSERLLGTTQRVINHNSDGTKSVNLVGYYPIAATISGQYYASVSVSGTAVLDNIPRISVPTLSHSSRLFGESITINTNRADSSFTHTIRYSFGGLNNQTIATGVGVSTSWEIPLSLMNQIPNSTSGTCTIICLTYSGSTYIGQSSASLTLNVPSNIVPTINSATITEAVSGLNAKFGAYIQSKSRFNVVTSASGVYSSTISQIRVTLEGNHVYGSNTTTGIVTTSGTVTISVRVTDSRGRTTTGNYDRTVLAYSNPTISTFTASRNETTETIVNFGMDFNITTLGDANDREYILDYRQIAPIVSGWTTLISSTLHYTLNFTHDSEEGVFNVDNTYEVRFRVSDYFTTTTLIRTINPTFSLINFNPTGKGIAFGGISTGDNFEINDLPLIVNRDNATLATFIRPSAVSNVVLNFRNDNSTLGFLGYHMDGSLVRFGINSGASLLTSPKFVVDVTNSRVGINKSEPTVDLDVNGSTTISGTLRLPNSAGSTGSLFLQNDNFIAHINGGMTLYPNRQTGGSETFKIRSHTTMTGYRNEMVIDANSNVTFLGGVNAPFITTAGGSVVAGETFRSQLKIERTGGTLAAVIEYANTGGVIGALGFTNAGLVHYVGSTSTIAWHSDNDGILQIGTVPFERTTGCAASSHTHAASAINSGTFAIERGFAASSTSNGLCRIRSDRNSGEFYGGSTNPVNAGRSNYDGNFYARNFYSSTTSVYSFSDLRMKKDIKPIDKEVDLILQLEPISYMLKDEHDTQIDTTSDIALARKSSDLPRADEVQKGKRHFGFIAQDVEVLMGKLGIEKNGILDEPSDQDEYYSIGYTGLIAPMIKTIQVLNDRIVKLEEKIADGK